jgi:hypothetical protein
MGSGFKGSGFHSRPWTAFGVKKNGFFVLNPEPLNPEPGTDHF